MIALHVQDPTSGVWGAWTSDPIALFVVPIMFVLYLRGIMKSKGSKLNRHPRWRRLSFYFGISSLFIVLASPLDYLSGEYFFAHMIQHFVLVNVAAPLILLGYPMIPVLRGVPVGFRRNLLTPFLKLRVLRLMLKTLSRPLITWPLYVGTLLFWHFPFAYGAALSNEGIHLLQHAMFFLTAVAWWWNVIDPVPLKPNLKDLERIPYIFLTTVPIFVLGAFITFANSPTYEYYAVLQGHTLSAIEDQQIGGIIMWIPGSLLLMSTLLIVLIRVVKVEEKTQIEAERNS